MRASLRSLCSKQLLNIFCFKIIPNTPNSFKMNFLPKFNIIHISLVLYLLSFSTLYKANYHHQQLQYFKQKISNSEDLALSVLKYNSHKDRYDVRTQQCYIGFIVATILSAIKIFLIYSEKNHFSKLLKNKSNTSK